MRADAFERRRKDCASAELEGCDRSSPRLHRIPPAVAGASEACATHFQNNINIRNLEALSMGRHSLNKGKRGEREAAATSRADKISSPKPATLPFAS